MVNYISCSIISQQDAKTWVESVIHSPIKWTGDNGLTNCPLPSHGGPDRHPSFSIDISKPAFFCHTEQVGGSFRDLAELLGVEWLDDRPSTVKPKKEIKAVYDYTDEAGKLIYQVVRYNPKGFSQRRPNGKGGMVWNMQGVTPLPYKLPELLRATKESKTVVFIVEGEKDVQTLNRFGLIATCNHGGAAKWRDAHSSHFPKGTSIVILTDNDDAGRKHGGIVARSLSKRGCKIKVIDLPELPPKGDVSDWLAAGHTKDELLKLVKNATDWKDNGLSADSSESDNPVNKTQVGMLLEMCSQVELIHNAVGETFGRFPVGNHVETLNIKSQNTKRWLTHKFFTETKLTPAPDAVTRVINNLDAMAYIEGKKVDLSLRVAESEGAFWYDLANNDWKAIKVTPGRWEVIENPPALFIRAANTAQQTLPWPVDKHELLKVLDFVNLESKDEQILFVVELVSTLIPNIPHIVSVFHGEKGSSKSTVMRVRRKLIDPAFQELQIMPKDVKELPLLLAKNWLPCFDNLDGISNEVSDILCVAATGGGMSKRTLYTDADETMLNFKRCIALNGISEPATRPDLLDRAILFELQRIAESQRKSESDFWKEFDEFRPRILGAMFKVLADAMTIFPTVKLEKLPRMADFARWGYAIAEAIYPGGGMNFIKALESNKLIITEQAIRANPVALAINQLMVNQHNWTGTGGELLFALERIAWDVKIDVRAKNWPKSAQGLAWKLRQVRSNLTDIGIGLSETMDKRRRQAVYSLSVNRDNQAN